MKIPPAVQIDTYGQKRRLYFIPKHLSVFYVLFELRTSATTREILAAKGGTVGEKVSGNFA